MITYRSTDRVEYVCAEDPAVDHSHPDYDLTQYLKTFDRKFCPLKEGHLPTVFHLARLTRAQDLAVKRASDADRDMERVAFGLKQVDNLKDRDGQPVMLRFKQHGNLGKRVDDESLDRIYSPALFAELGAVVHLLAGLDPLAEKPST